MVASIHRSTLSCFVLSSSSSLRRIAIARLTVANDGIRYRDLRPKPCGGAVWFINNHTRHRCTRRLAVRVKAAEADKDTCAVVFKLKHRCSFGEHMLVVGKGARLGDWNVEDAKSMKWSDGDNWMLVLDLAPGAYQFKCVVFNEKTSEATWETGENRIVHIAEGQKALEVCCLFGQTTQTDVMQLNSAHAEAALAAVGASRISTAAAAAVEQPYVQGSYEVGGYEGLTTSFASTDSLLLNGEHPRSSGSRGNAWDDVLEGVYDEPHIGNGSSNGNGHENGNTNGHAIDHDEVLLTNQGTYIYNGNGAARGALGSDPEDPPARSQPSPDNPRSIWEQYKSSRGLSSLGSAGSGSAWGSGDTAGASGSLGGSVGGSYGSLDDEDEDRGLGSLTRKGGKSFISRNNSANAAAWLGGSKLDQLQEQKIRDLQAELRRTENIRARLKEELSKVVVQSIESQKEVSKLQSEVQSLLTQRNSTLLQLSSMQSAVKESTKEVNRLKAQLEDTEHHLRSQSNQLSSRIAGLESERSQMVQEAARLKNALEEKEQELVGQTTALRETIWKLEDEKHALLEETSDLMGRLEELEGDLRKQNTALQQQIHVLQAEKEQALGQVARLRSELAEKDSELKQQTKELRDTVLALEESKTQATTDMAAMKQQMEEKEAQLREEREEVQRRMAEVEAEHQRTLNEVSRLEKQMEEREVGLEQQTQQLQQAIRALEDEKRRTADEVGQLAEHLSRKEQEAKAHSLQLAQQIQLLHEERQEALDEIEKLHAAIEQVNYEKERSVSEVDQLRSTLNQQESRAARQQRDLEELNNRLRQEVEQLRRGGHVSATSSFSWDTPSSAYSSSSNNQAASSTSATDDSYVHPWVREHMPQISPAADTSAGSLWGSSSAAATSMSAAASSGSGYRRSSGDRPRQRDNGRPVRNQEAEPAGAVVFDWSTNGSHSSSSISSGHETTNLSGAGSRSSDWTHPYFQQQAGQVAASDSSADAATDSQGGWTHPWLQQRQQDLESLAGADVSSQGTSTSTPAQGRPSYEARRQGASSRGRGTGRGNPSASSNSNSSGSGSQGKAAVESGWGASAGGQASGSAYSSRVQTGARQGSSRAPRPSSRPQRSGSAAQASATSSWANGSSSSSWAGEGRDHPYFQKPQEAAADSFFSSATTVATADKEEWVHPYFAEHQRSSSLGSVTQDDSSKWTHPWVQEHASQLASLGGVAAEDRTTYSSSSAGWDEEERVHPWFREQQMSSIDEVSKAVLLEVEALNGENTMLEREITRIRSHIHELASHKEGAKAEVQRLLAALREKEAKLKLR